MLVRDIKKIEERVSEKIETFHFLRNIITILFDIVI